MGDDQYQSNYGYNMQIDEMSTEVELSHGFVVKLHEVTSILRTFRDTDMNR